MEERESDNDRNHRSRDRDPSAEQTENDRNRVAKAENTDPNASTTEVISRSTTPETPQDEFSEEKKDDNNGSDERSENYRDFHSLTLDDFRSILSDESLNPTVPFFLYAEGANLWVELLVSPGEHLEENKIFATHFFHLLEQEYPQRDIPHILATLFYYYNHQVTAEDFLKGNIFITKIFLSALFQQLDTLSSDTLSSQESYAPERPYASDQEWQSPYLAYYPNVQQVPFYYYTMPYYDWEQMNQHTVYFPTPFAIPAHDGLGYFVGGTWFPYANQASLYTPSVTREQPSLPQARRLSPSLDETTLDLSSGSSKSRSERSVSTLTASPDISWHGNERVDRSKLEEFVARRAQQQRILKLGVYASDSLPTSDEDFSSSPSLESPPQAAALRQEERDVTLENRKKTFLEALTTNLAERSHDRENKRVRTSAATVPTPPLKKSLDADISSLNKQSKETQIPKEAVERPWIDVKKIPPARRSLADLADLPGQQSSRNYYTILRPDEDPVLLEEPAPLDAAKIPQSNKQQTLRQGERKKIAKRPRRRIQTVAQDDWDDLPPLIEQKQELLAARETHSTEPAEERLEQEDYIPPLITFIVENAYHIGREYARLLAKIPSLIYDYAIDRPLNGWAVLGRYNIRDIYHRIEQERLAYREAYNKELILQKLRKKMRVFDEAWARGGPQLNAMRRAQGEPPITKLEAWEAVKRVQKKVERGEMTLEQLLENEKKTREQLKQVNGQSNLVN